MDSVSDTAKVGARSAIDPALVSSRTGRNEVVVSFATESWSQEMGTRLFVGNLSFETTEADLRGAFKESGLEVTEVKVVTERDTGRPRGFAFVEMTTAAGAAQAMQQLDGRELGGRQINVKEANERPGGGGARSRAR